MNVFLFQYQNYLKNRIFTLIKNYLCELPYTDLWEPENQAWEKL